MNNKLIHISLHDVCFYPNQQPYKVRFTSEDINGLAAAAKESENKFTLLDLKYKSLSAEAKKKKLLLPEELKAFALYMKKMEESQDLEESQSISNLNVNDTKEVDNFDFGEFGGDDDVYLAPLASTVMSTPSTTTTTNAESTAVTTNNANSINDSVLDSVLEEVFQFHIDANNYLNAYRSLVVDIVKRKQKEVLIYTFSILCVVPPLTFLNTLIY